MSKELLRQGDITANTYIDPGAETRDAYEISKKSRTLARSVIGNENLEDRIRQRCSVAVGDFGMADLIRFSHNPVAATLSALLGGAPIITDIRMVQVGIQKKGIPARFCAHSISVQRSPMHGELPEVQPVFSLLRKSSADRLSLLAMHPLHSCPCAKWSMRGYALR